MYAGVYLWYNSYDPLFVLKLYIRSFSVTPPNPPFGNFPHSCGVYVLIRESNIINLLFICSDFLSVFTFKFTFQNYYTAAVSVSFFSIYLEPILSIKAFSILYLTRSLNKFLKN